DPSKPDSIAIRDVHEGNEPASFRGHLRCSSDEATLETGLDGNQLDGKVKLSRKGTLLLSTQYKAGKQDGLRREYDDKGELISEMTFRAGRLEGAFTRLNESSAECQGTYISANEGKKLKIIEVYTKGTIESREVRKDGDIVCQTDYVNGSPHDELQ